MSVPKEVWVPDAQGLLHRGEFSRSFPGTAGKGEHRECSSTRLLLYHHPVGTQTPHPQPWERVLPFLNVLWNSLCSQHTMGKRKSRWWGISSAWGEGQVEQSCPGAVSSPRKGDGSLAGAWGFELDGYSHLACLAEIPSL